MFERDAPASEINVKAVCFSGYLKACVQFKRPINESLTAIIIVEVGHLTLKGQNNIN